MKNKSTADSAVKPKRKTAYAAMANNQATASVWTPDYVLRLQQNIQPCGCPGCNNASPLMQFRWRNHVRYSADMGCRKAAIEILNRTASCTITFSEGAAESLPELAADRLQMNQLCLHLFTAFRTEPTLLIYLLGRFIREAAALDTQQRVALQEAWLQPDFRQTLRLDFSRSHSPDDYPPVRLHTLRELPLWSLAEEDRRLKKLEKLKSTGEEALRQRWRELENTSGFSAAAQQEILGNYLFYLLCHHFFPGNPVEEWQKNFAVLCRRVLNLKTLLIVMSTEANMENLGALFADCHRKVMACWR
ncbi:hypothetical protein [Kalamiella sp. sgz302252]|uniref:hypothetical protein n=1 Tax=Pantoea sp. sgz302252 TaxID=3341827 RepID=UPI0036D34C35